MSSRGRRRGSSQSSAPRQDSVRRSSAHRGISRQRQRRSLRLMGLPAPRDGELATRVGYHDTPNTSQVSMESQQASLAPFDTTPYLNGLEVRAPPGSFTVNGVDPYHLTGVGSARSTAATRCLTPLADSGIQLNRMFNLTILIQPPRQIQPGSFFDVPIVVRIGQRLQEGPFQESINNDSLYAILSVVTEDGMTMLSPPRADLLLGSTANSVHSADQIINQHDSPISSSHFLTPTSREQEAGITFFPNVGIRDAGHFRIRISLMRLNTSGTSSADMFGGDFGNLQSITSQIIEVDYDAVIPQRG
ncbi:hypothetical protein MMC14_008754 [Varicellaria rhodocarpa]|nr:hypothetical protein [Varicellaria rhodocarpa]